MAPAAPLSSRSAARRRRGGVPCARTLVQAGSRPQCHAAPSPPGRRRGGGAPSERPRRKRRPALGPLYSACVHAAGAGSTRAFSRRRRAAIVQQSILLATVRRATNQSSPRSPYGAVRRHLQGPPADAAGAQICHPGRRATPGAAQPRLDTTARGREPRAVRRREPAAARPRHARRPLADEVQAEAAVPPPRGCAPSAGGDTKANRTRWPKEGPRSWRPRASGASPFHMQRRPGRHLSEYEAAIAGYGAANPRASRA